MVDVLALNRRAWDIQSANAASPWVQPVDSATIARARQGDWQVILTPTTAVPRHWFGDLPNARLLALASGGGQQAPVLAAAGARVVSFDNSATQLAKDQQVAQREGLDIDTQQGDMADLSRFADASFDVIFNPVSNVFAPTLAPIWAECARVLKPGGRLLAGFMNPAFFLFDHEAIEAGAPLEVTFPLPFSDVEHLSDEAITERIEAGYALEFGHNLDSQIGAQLQAGFMLADLFEDRWNNAATPLNEFMPTSMATLGIRQ